MRDKHPPRHDPCWEAAWDWVQRQHEAGFDDAAFNAALNQWLQSDPAHRRSYEEAALLWRVAGLVRPRDAVPAAQELPPP